MKKSGLQFQNPRLVEMEFRINEEYCNQGDGPIDINLSFDVNINKLDGTSEAIVELTVVIGAEDDLNPFYIRATEGAMFKWDDEMKDREDALLEENAPAVLLGYLRSVISMITAASPFAAYNIPLINFKKK